MENQAKLQLVALLIDTANASFAAVGKSAKVKREAGGETV